MAEVPLGPVQFQFSGLGKRVAYEGERSHHWYDKMYSVFATAMAYVKGRNDPEVKTIRETAELVKKWKQVGPSAVIGWASYLRRERPEGRPFMVVESWIHPLASGTLAKNETVEEVRDQAYEELQDQFDKAPHKGLLFVPLIIGQGLLEVHHIVWVTADLKTKQVEYYDPKGIELAENDAKHRLVLGVIAALMYVSGFKEVVQNPVRHQYDINNCGVLGMGYLSRRRRKDKTFADFCLGKGADLGEIRTWMAKEMLEKPSLVEEFGEDSREEMMGFEM